MSIDPQTLRSEQFLSIGLLIQQGAETLLARWCQQAVAEQPTAPRVHHAILQDQLRKLLTALGHGLVVCNDQDLPQHHLIALEHGEQRREAGWSLSEVVRDYQIMRLVILDYLDEQLDRPLTTREMMAIGLALDEASMASVDAYVKYGEQMRQEAVELSLHFERRTNEALRQAPMNWRMPSAVPTNFWRRWPMNCETRWLQSSLRPRRPACKDRPIRPTLKPGKWSSGKCSS